MATRRVAAARTIAGDPLRAPKRGDLVVEEIKRWIVTRELKPGDKLPKEAELQAAFSVSKGTIREALKSLDVQGFISVSTGPSGGATVVEVPFERTFQLVQNYLFFKGVDVGDIYAVRRILEPELAAGAVPHLTKQDFAALEASIETCAPTPADVDQARRQRQEDLHFHDIFAEANPNPFLRFSCQMINQMLRRLVVFGISPMHAHYHELGRTNVAAHRALVNAARKRDAEKVRKLMLAHIVEAESHVRKLQGAVSSRLVLDSEMRVSVTPRHAGIRR
ncbi:MAG TPA: FCD domain-containing protein [Vineibacter sp.]|nr:FCD domain-containing protein [Vineibacter sp.]